MLPLTFAEASHLGRYDVIAAHHVVCELDAELRREFWAFIRNHLTDGGRAWVDSHIGPTPGPDVELALRAEACGPSHVVERWFGAAEADDGAGRVTTTEYVVRTQAGAGVQTTRTSRLMPYFDADKVRRELDDAGLALDDQGTWWHLTLAHEA